jgi:hypothetical protein
MRSTLLILAALAALPAPAAAQPTADSFTSPTPAGLRRGAVRSGMDYDAFRRAITSAGWRAARDPDCVQGVYGGDGTRSPGEPNVCRDLPEIEACSGDGYCVMNFSNPRTRRRIRVTTYGDYGGWQRPGRLSVLGWEQR